MKSLLEAIRPTVFIESEKLKTFLNLDLTIASETFQHTGSFKFRAAYNLALNVENDEILTASSGNFGQALAFACKLTGIKCTVVMPETSAKVKIEAVRNYGATVDLVDTKKVGRNERVAQLAEQMKGVYVASAYDDLLVIEGNSTLGDEISAKDFDVVISPVGGGKLVEKTVKESNRAKRSDLLSVYPEFSGIDAAAAAKLNAAIKKYVTDVDDAYRKDLAEYSVEDVKAMPDSAGLASEISYDVALANDAVISLTFYNYSYTGGAHGTTGSSTINYDLKNNRELKLTDIFAPNADYLDTLSELSRVDLKAQKIEATDDEMLNEGTTATEENFSSWNLTKKGLQINFDAYQVASYAAGAQTVIIPYAKLEKILKKDGVIAGLIK